jgi:hypothetical protein
MKTDVIGDGKPIVAVVGCVHGNEVIGEKVINHLKRLKPEKGTLELVIANEEAAQQNKRFIDTDLNRAFPGNTYGNKEQRLAVMLRGALSHCDYIIDIHSTTGNTDDFVIITQPNDDKYRLADYSCIPKVVVMERFMAKGGALIDHVRCGISLEFDQGTGVGYAYDRVLYCLKGIGIVEGTPPHIEQQVYSAYGALMKPKLENFRETTVDGETFLPVLFGEKAYEDILCLKARRLK